MSEFGDKCYGIKKGSCEKRKSGNKFDENSPFAKIAWKLVCPKRQLIFIMCQFCNDRMYKNFNKVKFMMSGDALVSFLLCPDCISCTIEETNRYRALTSNKCFDNQHQEEKADSSSDQGYSSSEEIADE